MKDLYQGIKYMSSNLALGTIFLKQSIVHPEKFFGSEKVCRFMPEFQNQVESSMETEETYVTSNPWGFLRNLESNKYSS